MKYRAEVDGLRSIAVLPVIMFHAGVSLISGGYVGVDVFFVISGYLITGILVEEMTKGQFSLVNFYERRARRILPALFIVMAACLPFAWAWMLPAEMLNFTRSLVAMSLFASNVLFYIQAGYFGPNAEELPLLHTWSLAVEEQFYIVFPLLLLVLWQLRYSAVMAILAALMLVSLALCHWLITPQPDATFYLIHTRAWELLAGALVALWQRRGGKWAYGRSEIGSGLGLLAVLWGVFMFDEGTPFPSLWTVLPVGGTALILLFAGPSTAVARLLSLKPMVWIGLISYSAYLIHQPLLAFARIRSIGEPDPLLMYTLAGLTFPLAWLSWRFVEQPFRQKHRVGRRAIFAGAAVGLSVFIAVGMAGHVTRGIPGRLPEEVVAMAAVTHERNRKRADCMTTSIPLKADPKCVFEGTPRVAFLGDSHADALASGLRPALRQAGFGIYEATAAGCWPLPGFFRVNDQAARCSRKNERIWEIVGQRGDDVIVLAARWTLYVLGTRFDNGEGGVEPSGQIPSVEPLDWQGDLGNSKNSARRKRVLEKMQEQLLKLLDQHRIVLVYPIPEAGWNVPANQAKMEFYHGVPSELSTSEAVYHLRNAEIIALFDSITHSNLYRVRSSKTFCDLIEPGRCANTLDGHPLYRDDNHLSRAGADLLSKEIMNIISTIPLQPDD